MDLTLYTFLPRCQGIDLTLIVLSQLGGLLNELTVALDMLIVLLLMSLPEMTELGLVAGLQPLVVLA